MLARKVRVSMGAGYCGQHGTKQHRDGYDHMQCRRQCVRGRRYAPLITLSFYLLPPFSSFPLLMWVLGRKWWVTEPKVINTVTWNQGDIFFWTKKNHDLLTPFSGHLRPKITAQNGPKMATRWPQDSSRWPCGQAAYAWCFESHSTEQLPDKYNHMKCCCAWYSSE